MRGTFQSRAAHAIGLPFFGLRVYREIVINVLETFQRQRLNRQMHGDVYLIAEGGVATKVSAWKNNVLLFHYYIESKQIIFYVSFLILKIVAKHMYLASSSDFY